MYKQYTSNEFCQLLHTLKYYVIVTAGNVLQIRGYELIKKMEWHSISFDVFLFLS